MVGVISEEKKHKKATDEKVLPVWTYGSWHKSRKSTCSTLIGKTTARKKWNTTIPEPQQS